MADLQAGDLRPAFAGPGAQPLFQGGLGGVRVSGHGSHLLLAACAIAVAWCRALAGSGIRTRLRHIERMPMPSPYQIVLSGDEQAVLTARARSARGAVPRPAAGRDRARRGGRPGQRRDRRRRWGCAPTRSASGAAGSPAGRLAGLTDAPRSGRPPVFTAADRAEVVALACALPAESGVPLSRWSGPDLARELAARCRHRGLGVHDPPVAGRRRPQALAAPVLDLRPRPGLRGQGRPRCWTCTPGSGTAGRWAPATT